MTMILMIIGIALALTLFMAGPALKDASLKDSKALPNGAATIYSVGLDTG